MYGFEFRGPEFRRFILFAAAAAAVALLICGFVILANFIAADRIMPYEYQAARYHRDLLKGDAQNTASFKTVILGDSVASRNLFPNELPAISPISLALAGSGMNEAYYLFEKLLKRPHQLRCAIIMTSYGAFNFHQQTKFWQYTIPNENFNLGDLSDYFDETAKLGFYPGANLPKAWFLARAAYTKIAFYANFGVLNRYWLYPYISRVHSRRSYRTLRNMRGAFPLSLSQVWETPEFNGENQHYLQLPFEALPVIDRYLERIFKLAEQNGIKVLLTFGPIAESLRTSASEAWTRDFAAHIQKMTAGHANVKNRVEIRWQQDLDFIDGTHFAEPAATEWIKNHRAMLESCGDL